MYTNDFRSNLKKASGGKLGLSDITSQFSGFMPTDEVVYAVRTPNPKVWILIFSSVPILGPTGTKPTKPVRLAYAKIEQGNIVGVTGTVHKLNRVSALYENIVKKITDMAVNAQDDEYAEALEFIQ